MGCYDDEYDYHAQAKRIGESRALYSAAALAAAFLLVAIAFLG